MAEKIAPTSVRFYLSEDIRAEADGKQSLLGLYPEDRFLITIPEGAPVPAPAAPLAFEGFSILAVFDFASGEFNLSMKMMGPSDQLLFEAKQGKIATQRPGTLSFGAKFRPFLIPEFGRYRYVLTLDGKDFEFAFEMDKGEAAQPSPPIGVQRIGFEKIEGVHGLPTPDSPKA